MGKLSWIISVGRQEIPWTEEAMWRSRFNVGLEIGVMQFLAEGCWQPPEAGRCEEHVDSRSPRASWGSIHLIWSSGVDFLLLAHRIVREYISVVSVSHQVCGNLLQQPQVSNTDGKLKITNTARAGTSPHHTTSYAVFSLVPYWWVGEGRS